MKSLCSPGTPVAIALSASPAPAFAPRTFEAARKAPWSSQVATPESSGSRLREKNDRHGLSLPATPVDFAGKTLPWWKRGLDLAACLAGMPLLLLCTLLMVPLTQCTSPGPVFYWQERIGYQGRRFLIYKFRTMKVGADHSVHQEHTKSLIGTNAPMVKLDHRGDSRLIPGAWLLRASGLDELPQLINVLWGEMSLVGPRPCLPTEFEHLDLFQRQRCEGLPGLTGLWQVSGKNRTTFERMIQLDIEYVQKPSFWMDLKIILRTVPSLLVQIHETRQARKSKLQQTAELVTIAPFSRPSSESAQPWSKQ